MGRVFRGFEMTPKYSMYQDRIMMPSQQVKNVLLYDIRRVPAFSGLSLTHNSSQDFSGAGSASTTEILGIYGFSISLEQL